MRSEDRESALRGLSLLLFVSACGLFPDLGGLSSDAGEISDVKSDKVVLPTDGGGDVVSVPDADAATVTYFRTITIKNNASQALPKNYTIGVAFLKKSNHYQRLFEQALQNLEHVVQELRKRKLPKTWRCVNG